MSPQEAGDGLESMIEFQVQIKGHNQREYEDKWQGWQNWHRDPIACAALVFKNRLLGLANFLGGKMDPFS